MRFRLLAGKHYTRNPEYSKTDNRGVTRDLEHPAGTIIESDEDLAAKYANKFERYRDPDEQTEVTQERKDAADELIRSGMWTEGDRGFLHRLNGVDFERVNRAVVRSRAPTPTPAPSPPREKPAERPPEKPEEREEDHPLGEEVTGFYPAAAEQGFRVFRNPAGKHQVLNTRLAGKKKEKPINPSPLEAGDVEAFITAYQKES